MHSFKQKKTIITNYILDFETFYLQHFLVYIFYYKILILISNIKSGRIKQEAYIRSKRSEKMALSHVCIYVYNSLSSAHEMHRANLFSYATTRADTCSRTCTRKSLLLHPHTDNSSCACTRVRTCVHIHARAGKIAAQITTRLSSLRSTKDIAPVKLCVP